MARYRGTLTNCTHIIVSLLKACKVAVVRTECDDAAFQHHHFKKVHKRFADCTHIIACLLKAYKVAVARTDATMPPFNIISRRSTPEIVLHLKTTRKRR